MYILTIIAIIVIILVGNTHYLEKCETLMYNNVYII